MRPTAPHQHLNAAAHTAHTHCTQSQVSGFLDMAAEETPDDKKRALAEVVALGEQVWVKVSWGDSHTTCVCGGGGNSDFGWSAQGSVAEVVAMGEQAWVKVRRTNLIIGSH